MVVAEPQAPIRILLVSYYFPPDLSAGSFRAEALAKCLVQCGKNIILDIVTTEPNRYSNHRPAVNDNANEPFTVQRIPLPDVATGLPGQVRCFAEFARKAYQSTRFHHYDVVVATSSRLMTACLGAELAKKKRARLYLDIRDIFVESMNDVFPGILFRPLSWVFDKMERSTIERADRINLVSRGFLPYFQQRYDRQDYRFFTNGVDDLFVELASKPAGELPHVAKGSRLNIVYAGNIGDGQGLDEIIPELALRINDIATFTIVGDGGTRQKLVDRCRDLSAPVTFLDAVPRRELLEIYDSADVLFLHLNDLSAFTRVLPSKLFEYAALGKPILAGVKGHARSFIEEHVEGAAVFDPCDIDGAEKALRGLSLNALQRESFVKTFSRERIMREMAADVIDLAMVKHGE